MYEHFIIYSQTKKLHLKSDYQNKYKNAFAGRCLSFHGGQ